MNVRVYGIEDCVFCDLAKNHLTFKKIDFEYIQLEDSDKKSRLILETGCREFPQIFVGGAFIGGYDNLKTLKLDRVTPHRLKEITGEVHESMCHEKTSGDRFILINGSTEFEYSDIYSLYKKEQAVIWLVEEIDLDGDINDWVSCSDDEKHFITKILAFFASLDQIVMENVSINFGEEIIIPQIRSHFTIQNFIESVHGETYALLIQTYIKDPEEQLRVLKSVQTIPIIRKKAVWVQKWMDAETVSLAERLIGFTCIEGIQFSGAFCAIYWLKKQGKFKGLCFANSLIARDEGLHAEGSVLIYKHLEHKLPESRVHEIFREAVDVEHEFIRDALPVNLIGINQDTMSSYIEYVADFWLVKLGYQKVYNSVNPFEWMELLGMEGKQNFFEGRVAEYSKPGVMVNKEDQEFTIDANF